MAREQEPKRGMETLREAIDRLQRRGFCQSFRPGRGGALVDSTHGRLDPEELVVEEIVRFEGESDPGDEAVLFALRTADGRLRGTFSTTYGTQLDPESAAVLERLRQASQKSI